MLCEIQISRSCLNSNARLPDVAKRVPRKVPAVEQTTPWIGVPGNRVAVRITAAGKIQIEGETTVPPGASQSIRIDYLPDLEERIRESLRGKPLLTVADVAERMTVAESWVRRHARTLGGVSLGDGRGNDLHFRPDAVDAFIAKRTVQ